MKTNEEITKETIIGASYRANRYEEHEMVVDPARVAELIMEALTAKDAEFDKRIKEALPPKKFLNFDKGRKYGETFGHNACRQQIIDNLKL